MTTPENSVEPAPTVLIVDDDPGARLLLGTALEMAGFRVTSRRQRRRRARRISRAAGRLHHSRRGDAGNERLRHVHARCARCLTATTCPS